MGGVPSHGVSLSVPLAFRPPGGSAGSVVRLRLRVASGHHFTGGWGAMRGAAVVFVIQVLEGDSSSTRCGQTEHQHNQFSMSDPTHWH